MPKYMVTLLRTDTFTMEIEAADEDEALDKGFDNAPQLSAVESGWGQEYCIDGGEWYDPDEGDGIKAVELIKD